MCQGWGVRCPLEHTSSSLWRGGTGRACTGRRERTRGSPHCHSWAAWPPPGPTAAPGHTRTLKREGARGVSTQPGQSHRSLGWGRGWQDAEQEGEEPGAPRGSPCHVSVIGYMRCPRGLPRRRRTDPTGGHHPLLQGPTSGRHHGTWPHPEESGPAPPATGLDPVTLQHRQ